MRSFFFEANKKMEKETVIDPKNLDNYKDLIKDFKPPKRGRYKLPYILFGAWKINYSVEGNTYGDNINYRLFCLSLPAGVPSQGKIEQYTEGKAYPVLDFYFPTVEDLPQEDEGIESGYVNIVRAGHKRGKDPYNEIKHFLRSKQRNALREDDANKEISKLKLELEAERKRHSKKEVKDNEKNTSSRSKASSS